MTTQEMNHYSANYRHNQENCHLPDVLMKQVTAKLDGREFRGRVIGLDLRSRKRPVVFETTCGKYYNMTLIALQRLEVK